MSDGQETLIATEARGRYLGVDPGLARTGYALISRSARGPVLLEGGVIETDRKAALHLRLKELAEGLREVIEELKPDVAAMEKVFANPRNLKSSLLLAQARGALLLTLAEGRLPLVQYEPTRIKRLLTGSGRAPKEQIQMAICRELQLKKMPEPHDVADASAIALCLYHSLRFAA